MHNIIHKIQYLHNSIFPSFTFLLALSSLSCECFERKDNETLTEYLKDKYFFSMVLINGCFEVLPSNILRGLNAMLESPTGPM